MSEKSKNAREQMARVRLSDIYHKVWGRRERKEAEIAMLTEVGGGGGGERRRRRNVSFIRCLSWTVDLFLSSSPPKRSTSVGMEGTKLTRGGGGRRRGCERDMLSSVVNVEGEEKGKEEEKIRFRKISISHFRSAALLPSSSSSSSSSSPPPTSR